jgi:hypothetical protein
MSAEREQFLIDLTRPVVTTDDEVYRLLADLAAVEHAHSIIRDALQVALTRMHADHKTIISLRAQLAAAREELRGAR